LGGGIGKLSALRVATLSRKREAGMFGDGGGLYLQVTSGGASWVFRYKRGGRRTPRDMGLGPLHTIGLAEARERARQCRQQLLDGKDPLDERRAVREAQRVARATEQTKAMTFRQCAEGYLLANEDTWKNPKHRQQWRNTLATYVYPVCGELPIQQVDEAAIIKALMPIWHEKAETARRVRMRIETIIEWAIASKFFVGDNPAKRERLKHLLGKQSDTVKHYAAMPYREIGGFIVALREFDGVGSLPLEFCVLTGTRTNEVLGAHWDEIDRKTNTWTIPGERRKGKKGREAALTVPLSERCLDILGEAADLHGRTGLIFPNDAGKRLGENTLLNTLEQMGCAVTTHGFRSTFRDWAGDCTNFLRDIVEMALGHKVGNEVELAYRRGSALDKRRQLMEAWSRYCAKPTAERNGKVVAIGGR
jgi:integrase